MYTARKGETLVTIADRFGVSLDQLRRWNKLSGVKVAPGQRLHVAEPSAVPRTSHTRGHRYASSAAKASNAKGSNTKPSNAKPSAPASTKGKTNSASSHQQSQKAAANASQKKSQAPAAKSNHAQKPTAPAKSSTSKQK
jgi:membrane-bound lytic murein transglycosylase D